MAVISVLLGGMLGFLAALVGYLGFDLSALQALGLWSATGIAVMAGGLAYGHSFLLAPARLDPARA